VAIATGHILQHLSQSGQHPSVSAGPKILLAIHALVLGIDILSIAEVKPRLAIEHDRVGISHVVIELVEVCLVVGELIHLGHDGHHHVEGIGPPPVVGGLSVGDMAHHLFGTLYHLLVTGRGRLGVFYPVEVDIGLETNLPVAEEHIVLPLAVIPVLPF